MDTDASTLRTLCIRALRRAGATAPDAAALAEAILRAERRGRPAVGLLHLFDYLEAYRRGDIEPRPRQALRRRGTWVWADAGGGIPHGIFLRAVPKLERLARRRGSALLGLNRAYTCGELGDFTALLTERGLVALAATNSPALMAWGERGNTVLGTNPVSLAAPLDESGPLLIDQASSSTAYVSVREAADRGAQIPEGWAVDDAGRATTDARAALDGALLPYAGHRGANQALAVEVLAGLVGGRWSVDATGFEDSGGRGGGARGPGVGLFMLVVDPRSADPDFPARLRRHLHRLRDEHGVRLPGRGAAPAADAAAAGASLDVPEETLKRLRRAADGR